ENLKENYLKAYREYQRVKKELGKLFQVSENESGDSDYLEFLFNELEQASLQAGEQERIEEQLQIAESADDIRQGLSESLDLLDNDTQSILSSLRQANNLLSNLQKFDPLMGEWGQRVDSCRIELDDLRISIEEKLGTLDADPAEITRLDQRLSLIMTLQKKHNVQSVEELLSRKEELDHKISELSGVEENIKLLQKESEALLDTMKTAAAQLHESRKAVVPGLQEEIENLLTGLNMPDASFRIAVTEVEQYTVSGNDMVDFLFSANKGQQPSPLSKVASGGELSRVMLALKAILARTRNLPSIIFDEIDTGVSGETARKIGDILKKMGQLMQVMAISHLPQIASLGQHHFKVVKETDREQTFTRIRQLNEEERIDELARLLSGDNVSDAARENARELRKKVI
ncbi:MAG: DNA repair protein RecN, partial [Owenweeksia sp.]